MNGWVNNREAGDLRLHRDHYDVTVIKLSNTDLDPLHIAYEGISQVFYLPLK